MNITEKTLCIKTWKESQTCKNLYVCSFIETHKIPDTSLSSLQYEFFNQLSTPFLWKSGVFVVILLKQKCTKLGNSYISWGIMPQQSSLILTSKTDGTNAIYYITTSQNKNYSCMKSAEVDNFSGIFNILFWQIQSL